MRGKSVKQEVGYPDEMQAREMIIAACKELGTRAAFCEKVGLSKRYVNLIMEWLRPPTHWKLMAYFGWAEVYAVPEDLIESQLFPPVPRKKKGRPSVSSASVD